MECGERSVILINKDKTKGNDDIRVGVDETVQVWFFRGRVRVGIRKVLIVLILDVKRSSNRF